MSDLVSVLVRSTNPCVVFRFVFFFVFCFFIYFCFVLFLFLALVSDVSTLDSAMVGLVEQQLHIDAEFFIPAIIRSGFVKTILRKRAYQNRPVEILLEGDKAAWERDFFRYRSLGIVQSNATVNQ